MIKPIVILGCILAISQLGMVSHGSNTATSNTENYNGPSIPNEKTNFDYRESNDADRKKRNVVLLIPVPSSEEADNSQERESEEVDEPIHHGHKTKRCKAPNSQRKARRIPAAKQRRQYFSASTESSAIDSAENLDDGRSYYRLASVNNAKNILKSVLKSRSAKREDTDGIAERVSKPQDRDSINLVVRGAKRSGQRPKKYVCYCIEDNCGFKKTKKPIRPYATKRPIGPNDLAKSMTSEDNQRNSGLPSIERQVLGAPDDLHCPPGAVLVEEADYFERSSRKHESKRRPVKKCSPTITRCESDLPSIGQPTRINIPLSGNRKSNRRVYKVDRKLPFAQKLQSVIEQYEADGEVPYPEQEPSHDDAIEVQDYIDRPSDFDRYSEIPLVPNLVYPSPYVVYPQYPRYPQYPQYDDGLVGESQIPLQRADQPCEAHQEPWYEATPLGRNFIDIDECIRMFGRHFCIVTTTTTTTIASLPETVLNYEDEDDEPAVGSHWNERTEVTSTELPRDETTAWEYPVKIYDSNEDAVTHFQRPESVRDDEERLQHTDPYPESRIATVSKPYRVDGPRYYTDQSEYKKAQVGDNFSQATTQSYGIVGSNRYESTDFDEHETHIDRGFPLRQNEPDGFDYPIPVNSQEAVESVESETPDLDESEDEAKESQAPNMPSSVRVTEFPQSGKTIASSSWQGAHRISSPQYLEYTIDPNEKYVPLSSTEDASEEIAEHVPTTDRYSTQSFHRQQGRNGDEVNEYYSTRPSERVGMTKHYTMHESFDDDDEENENRSLASPTTVFAKMEEPWIDYESTIATDDSRANELQSFQRIATMYPAIDSEDRPVSTSLRPQSTDNPVNEYSVSPSSNLYYSIQPEEYAGNSASTIAMIASSNPQHVGTVRSDPVNAYPTSGFVSGAKSGDNNRYATSYVTMKNLAYDTTPLLGMNEPEQGEFTSLIATTPSYAEVVRTDSSQLDTTGDNEYSTEESSRSHFVGYHQSSINDDRATQKSLQQDFESRAPTTENYSSTPKATDYVEKSAEVQENQYMTSHIQNSPFENRESYSKEYSLDTEQPEDFANRYDEAPSANWYYTTQSRKTTTSSVDRQSTTDRSSHGQYVGSYNPIPSEAASTPGGSNSFDGPASYSGHMYSSMATEGLEEDLRGLPETLSKYNFYSTQYEDRLVTDSLQTAHPELAHSPEVDDYSSEHITNNYYMTEPSILGQTITDETGLTEKSQPFIATQSEYRNYEETNIPLDQSLPPSETTVSSYNVKMEDLPLTNPHLEEGGPKEIKDYGTMSSDDLRITGVTNGISYSTMIEEPEVNDGPKTIDTSGSDESERYPTKQDFGNVKLSQTTTENDELIGETQSHGTLRDDSFAPETTPQIIEQRTRHYSAPNYEGIALATSNYDTMSPESAGEIARMPNEEDFEKSRDPSYSSTSISTPSYLQNPSTPSHFLKSENIVPAESSTEDFGHEQKSYDYDKYSSSYNHQASTILNREDITSERTILVNTDSALGALKKLPNPTETPGTSAIGDAIEHSHDASYSSTPILVTHRFEDPSIFSHILKSENIVRDQFTTDITNSDYSTTNQYAQSTFESDAQNPIEDDFEYNENNDDNNFPSKDYQERPAFDREESTPRIDSSAFSNVVHDSTAVGDGLSFITNETPRWTTHDTVGNALRDENSSTIRDNLGAFIGNVDSSTENEYFAVSSARTESTFGTNIQNNNLGNIDILNDDRIMQPTSPSTETFKFEEFTPSYDLLRNALKAMTATDTRAEESTRLTTDGIIPRDDISEQIASSVQFTPSFDRARAPDGIKMSEVNDEKIIGSIVNSKVLQSDEPAYTSDRSPHEKSQTIEYTPYPYKPITPADAVGNAIGSHSFPGLQDVEYEDSTGSAYGATLKNKESVETALHTSSVTTAESADIMRPIATTESANSNYDGYPAFSSTNGIALTPLYTNYQTIPTNDSPSQAPQTVFSTYETTSSATAVGNTFEGPSFSDPTTSNIEYEDSKSSEHDLTPTNGIALQPLYTDYQTIPTNDSPSQAPQTVFSTYETTSSATAVGNTFEGPSFSDPTTSNIEYEDSKSSEHDLTPTNGIALQPPYTDYQTIPTNDSPSQAPQTVYSTYETTSSATAVGNTFEGPSFSDPTTSNVECEYSKSSEHDLTPMNEEPVGTALHTYSASTVEPAKEFTTISVNEFGGNTAPSSTIGIGLHPLHTVYQTSPTVQCTEEILRDNHICDKDRHILRSAVQKVVNDLLSPKSNNDYKFEAETPETVGEPKQGLLSGLPALKKLFSLPEVKDMAINTVKGMITAASGVPKESSLGRLEDHVIESVFNSVVDDLIPETMTPSSSMNVDEHRYENGHWTVVPATLTPGEGNVGLKSDGTISSSIQDILGRSGIGARGARLPVVQNIIVRAVENALTKAKNIVDHSVIWDTLNNVITRAENIARSSSASVVTAKSLPKYPAIETPSASMKNLPVIPVTEHVFKNGQWSEKNTVVGNARKSSEPKSPTSAIASDNNDLRTSIASYGASAIDANEPNYTIKAPDYALLGESEEDLDESTLKHVTGTTDDIPSETNIENVGATTDNGNIDRQVLEKSPIEYYSPHDRILTYIKNHPIPVKEVPIALSSLDTEPTTESYSPSSAMKSIEYTTIDDSLEFEHSTTSTSDEGLTRLAEESGLGAPEKTMTCKCTDEDKKNGDDKVGISQGSSAQQGKTVASLGEKENDSYLPSAIHHLDVNDRKNTEHTVEEFIGEKDPRITPTSSGAPEKEILLAEPQGFSSTIHHLDVTEYNDYPTEEYISTEDLSSEEAITDSSEKVGNAQLSSSRTTENDTYEEAASEEEVTQGYIGEADEQAEKAFVVKNSDSTGYFDFANNVPETGSPGTTFGDRVATTAEYENTSEGLDRKFPELPKRVDATLEATTPSRGSVGAAMRPGESDILRENPRVSSSFVTPKWDPTYFGKVSLSNRANPNGDGIPDLANTDLFYVGDGVRIPLTIRRMSDGSYALSISEKICENFVNRECPCCVPKEGDIVEEKRRSSDPEGNEYETTSRGNSYEADSFAPTESSEYASKSKKRYVRSTSGGDVIVTSSTPIRNFVRKYNLSLDLEKVRVPVESSMANERTAKKIGSPRKIKFSGSSDDAKISNLFENDNKIRSEDSEEDEPIVDDSSEIVSKESNTIRRSEFAYDGDANSFVRSLANIGDAPENDRAEIILNALDGLINSATVTPPDSAMAENTIEIIDEDPTVDSADYDLKEVENEMTRYGYQKDNPILERIRYIKEHRRQEHGRYKYQQNIDHHTRGKMNVLKTVLRWLREVFLESRVNGND